MPGRRAPEQLVAPEAVLAVPAASIARPGHEARSRQAVTAPTPVSAPMAGARATV